MLTYDKAHALLEYDPDTGVFKWRVNRHKYKAGTVAGVLNKAGYRRIKTGGKTYQASRVAMLMMTGVMPEGEVDHVNRNKSDDRWCNLRPATQSQNRANVVVRKHSASGFKCVTKRPSGRFQAYIRKDGVRKTLGTFDTVEEAHAKYVSSAQASFGEFAQA